MLKNKILAQDKCYTNYMHKEADIIRYKDSCEEVFNRISILEKEDKIVENLNGPIKEMGFNRLTN